MKKKGIAIVALLATSVALFAAGCKSNTPDGPNNPPDGPSGPTGDTYEDYSPNKQPGGDQFDFEGNYKEPELKIDGKGDDEQWLAITEPLLTFGHNNGVSVKAYRGAEALFFLFEVKDSVLLTNGTTNDDAVTRGDSIEFYIDSKADGGLHPQTDDFQINLGIHGKTRIMQGSGSNWGTWNGLIDYEVSLNGTLNDGDAANDVGYTIEAMIQYKDIAIDKDSTIAISFGQVDKWQTQDSPTGTAEGPWNWYGWTYKGSYTEPQTPDNYVLYLPDGTLLLRDEQEKAPAEMAGYVRDQNNNPVAGATVTVTGGSQEIAPITTNAEGFFLFENVDPEGTYTVTITKENFITTLQTYTRAELRAVDGGRVLKEFEMIDQSAIELTTLTGTVKNVMNGAVGGATVTVKNTEITTTAGADGTFSLANVPMVPVEGGGFADVTIVVKKSGYADSETVIKGSALLNPTTALDDVNLNLPLAVTGSFGKKNNLFADNSAQISRALDGLEFYFTGQRTFNGAIELYIDTKTTSQSMDAGTARDATDVQYQLTSDGKINVVNYGGGKFTAAGMKWEVTPLESGYTAKLFIPYTTLGINPLEPFGISLGQNNGQGDWDGWGRDDMKGTNKDGFVAPELPSDYIRFGADNKFYEAANNDISVTLSGNVGMKGVSVVVGALSTVTGDNGDWSMKMPQTSAEVSVVFTKQGYTPVTKTIAAGYFDSKYAWSENFTMQEQKVSIAGQVTDGENPIAGVTVTVEGTSLTATTDAQGMYTIANVPTFNDIRVAFTKDGFANGFEPITAVNLAKNDSHTLNKALTSNASVQKVTATGKIVGVDGPVAGATVAVVGNAELTATTNANGEFTIANFAGVDCKLSVTKKGYINGSFDFTASNLTAGETTYAFSDIFLVREAVCFGHTQDKGDAFTAFTGYVTRTQAGFEFTFVGKRTFENQDLEVFIHVGEETTRRQFTIRPDTTSVGNGCTLNVDTSNANEPVVKLFVPYTWFGEGVVSATDIVGLAAGEYTDRTDGDRWSPWCEVGSTSGFEVNDLWRYVRYAADNTLFRYDRNSLFVTLSGQTQAGVIVTAGGRTVTAGADGAWSMNIDKTAAAVEVTFAKSGYVSQTQTIAANYFDSASSWTAANVTLAAQQVEISGKVSDANGGVAGVTVAVEGHDTWTATTDASGNFSLTVTALENIKINITKTGYAAGTQSYTAAELVAATSGLTLNVTLIANSDIHEVTISGTVTGVGGAIAGATVEIKGTAYTTTTGADGTWSMSANAVDCTVTISKAGYIEDTIELKASEIDGETHALDELFLVREYAEFAVSQSIADPNEKSKPYTSEFTYYMTRSKDGFLFRFVGLKAFSTTAPTNRIELNISKADATDWAWIINIFPGGNHAFVKGSGTGVEVKMSNLDSDAPTIEMYVPYANAGVAATDTIRIAGGQYCDTGAGAGWNGMNINGGYVGAGWGEAHRIYVNMDNQSSDDLAAVQTANVAMISDSKKDEE